MASNTLFLEATYVNSDVPIGSNRHYEISLNSIKIVIYGPGFAYLILHGRRYCLIINHSENDNLDQIQIYDNPEILTDDPIFFTNCDTTVIRNFMQRIGETNTIEKVDVPASLEYNRTYLTTVERQNLLMHGQTVMT